MWDGEWELGFSLEVRLWILNLYPLFAPAFSPLQPARPVIFTQTETKAKQEGVTKTLYKYDREFCDWRNVASVRILVVLYLVQN